MRADLHSHTIYSDGKLTVNELIDRAINNNVDILAITDHDCFDGSIEAFNTNKNIKIIFGIELSTERNGESVHVLGYFKQPITSGPLFDALIKQRENRYIRANKILDLLNEHFRINLNRDFIYERQSITRGTISDQIIKQGYNYSKKEIFEYMLGNGCKAYLPSTKMTTEFGIKLIQDNGGIAVIAHPCLLKKNNVYDIIKLGIDGIEGRYPSKYNDETMYRRFAKNNKLLFTAGSDFHFVNDHGHGEVGQCTIDGSDLEKFLEVLYNEH